MEHKRIAVIVLRLVAADEDFRAFKISLYSKISLVEVYVPQIVM